MTIAEFREVWKPWVTTAAEEIVQRFPGTGNQGTYPGHDPNEAQAVDFMVAEERDGLGYRISRFLADKAVCERLGIWYVIWWGEIWSMTRPDNAGSGWSGERGWLAYFDADNPNPSRSHHNHVHVSFYGKAPRVVSAVAAATGSHHAKPTGQAYTLVLTKPTTGYDWNTGAVKYKAGADGHGAVGRKITGKIGRLSDGRYLVTAWSTAYPLDNHNFAHLDGTPVGK